MRRVLEWSRRLVGALLTGVVLSGCPQLLEDDFSTVPATGGAAGSGGESGDSSVSGGGTGGLTGGTGGTSGAGGSGASGGTGGSAGDAGPCSACASGETCCDDQCVDTSKAQEHCGACGKACPGTTCSSGQCTGTCALGFLDCDKNAVTGCEVDSAADPANCGSCGAECSFDQTCVLGKCTCPAGTASCDGQATNGCEANLTTDEANCGACGAACGANQACAAGKCECKPGFADCNGSKNDGCEVTLATDEKNCGACGTSCGTNGSCSQSKCGCLAGFQNCDATPGCEVALTDPQHCGSCTTVCPVTAPICDGTSCVLTCSGSETKCGSSCVDTNSNPLNCGGCSKPVGPNQQCVGGVAVCLSGFGDCNGTPGDGCEVDLTSDAAHCGTCATACKPGAVCSGSACQCSAATPNDCGSACRECCAASDCADSDPCTTESCDGVTGKCSKTGCTTGTVCCSTGCFECCVDSDCTGGKLCSGNKCANPSCTSPEVLCDGACVNPSTNAKHCGGCGVDCGFGRTCAAGACTPPWAPVSATGAPSARSHAAYAALSNPGRVFVWGGVDAASNVLDDGAIYDVSTNTWTAVPKDAATPSPRVLASAVWTGDRVFVWGGGSGSSDLDDGAFYDPAAKIWTPISSANKPSARRAPYLVWTGAEVLLWGGVDSNGTPLDQVYRYDPQSSAWTVGNANGEPSPRLHSTTGWSGSDFLVFGGRQGSNSFNHTFRYRLATDAWAQLGNGPSQRFGALGTWDGSFLIAWGGRKEGGGAPATYDDGRRFAGNLWTNLPTLGAPSARYAQHRQAGISARVANGATLLLGGLAPNGSALKDGAVYRSGNNSWTAVPAWPSGEEHLWAAWAFAGGELVLFGGQNGSTVTATGERLRP